MPKIEPVKLLIFGDRLIAQTKYRKVLVGWIQNHFETRELAQYVVRQINEALAWDTKRALEFLDRYNVGLDASDLLIPSRSGKTFIEGYPAFVDDDGHLKPFLSGEISVDEYWARWSSVHGPTYSYKQARSEDGRMIFSDELVRISDLQNSNFVFVVEDGVLHARILSE